MKRVIPAVIVVFFMTQMAMAQLTTPGYIFFNENRSFVNSRNWVVRQNNSHEGDLQFGCTGSNTGGVPDLYANPTEAKLTIQRDGNVGIGTTDPDAKLTVKGIVHAEEVRVDLNVPAPDYVFESDYKLPTLTEIEDYINQNKHLPEVPSAAEMEQRGIDLSEMNMVLLKKVEELTLYIIELKKENDQLKARTSDIEILRSEIESIKDSLSHR